MSGQLGVGGELRQVLSFPEIGVGPSPKTAWSRMLQPLWLRKQLVECGFELLGEWDGSGFGVQFSFVK